MDEGDVHFRPVSPEVSIFVHLSLVNLNQFAQQL